MKPFQYLPLIALCAFPNLCRADLIAHYTFDEPAGATTALNDVPGSATGAVGAAITTGVAGISGNAYSFVGATATQGDIVDMGNPAFLSAITTSGQFTFSAWVKTTDILGNRNTVVFAGDNTVNNVYSDLGVAAGQVGFLGSASARNRPVNAALPQQTGIYSSPTVAPVNDGNWHHLAMTVNLNTGLLTLWVDGVLANTQTMTIDALPTFNKFEIGRLGRLAATDSYNGLVDDVQVYDKALAPYQIAYLKNHPGQPYVAVDSDNDGLDDNWEIYYFGSITAQDGNGDPNGNGILNKDEQAAGTNPGTLPKVGSISFASGSDGVIHFTGNPNTLYRVTKSTTLSGFADMTPSITAITDASGVGTATIPASQITDPQAYYRLEVP